MSKKGNDKVKATEKWLKEQIADEKRSSKMYREKGHPEIAKDETKHKKILEKQLRGMQKR
jgi:hypothetical protein